MIRKPHIFWLDWLSLIVWAIIASAVFVALVDLIVISSLKGMGGYLLLIIVAMVTAWANAIRLNRRRRVLDILRYIQQAVDLNLPIPVTIWAAEQSEQGAIVPRLQTLRDKLSTGQSLEQSLADAVPEMPLAMVRQIGSAERLGQLPQALQRLTSRRRRERELPADQRAFYKAYLPAMLTILLGICAIMLTFVLPKFQQIFLDFKTSLPPATLLFLEISHNYLLIWIAIVILMIWMGQIISGIFNARLRYFGEFLDTIRWYTPIVHSRIRDKGLASLCTIVSSAAVASWPLDVSLREAAEAQANAVMRNRILRWAKAVEAGTPIQDGARLAKMPTIMIGMLAPARSNDDLAQVMTFLTRHYETRFERSEILIQAMYVPIIVAVLGLIVGFVTLSLFAPLVALIQTASSPAHYWSIR